MDWLMIAHRVGSAEFYWAIGAELLLLLWTALLLAAPRWDAAKLGGGWGFRLWGLGAALAAAGITWAGKTLEVWPGNPLFPSGHTAWAVTIAVFLVARDRRWLAWVVPLLALIAVALVLANYHVPVDIVGGLAVGLAAGCGGVALLKSLGAGRATGEAERAA